MTSSFVDNKFRIVKTPGSKWPECAICQKKVGCCQKAVGCPDCGFGIGPCCMEQNGKCWLCNLEGRAIQGGDMPAPKSRIIVLGASMVGAYFALCMAKKGFQVDVYEKAKELGTWHGVLNITNLMVKCLEVDGMLDEILAEHVKQLDLCFRGNNWNDIVGETSVGRDEHKYNIAPYFITCNRAKYLEQILDASKKAGARYHTDMEASAIEQKDGPGGTVKVSFKDGTTAEGDFMVACDGGQSLTRNTVFKAEGGSVQPESTLHWCANGIVRGFKGYPEKVAKFGSTELWGKKGIIGFFPYKDDQMYFYVLEKGNRPEHPKGMDRSEYQKILFDRISKDFASYDGFIQPMFDTAVDTSTMGAFELPQVGKALTTWNKGRVLLLGDAAHAMCNRLGAGGCTGMEDAHTAAELIELCMRSMGGGEKEAASIKEAFKLTTRRRYFRGLKVQGESMGFAEATVIMADSCMAGFIKSQVGKGLAPAPPGEMGGMDGLVFYRACKEHLVNGAQGPQKSKKEVELGS